MNGRPPIILNVDDTEVARYAKTRTLQHAGFQVEEAHDGGSALAFMEALRPDLVLLDVRLPDMNGIEVCRFIKSRWPSTFVLQTSATFVSSADRTRGLEGGADSYLIQPIDPGELVAAVKALLRLREAEEAMRQLNATLESRIEARTRELHEANQSLHDQIRQRERAESALVHAQKMEAVGQLAGTMAHDFNNILASLLGYAYMIRNKADDPDVLNWAQKSLDVIGRGKRLTSRVLTFSRKERHVNSAVDINAVLTGMREWLQQTVGGGVEVGFDTRDCPCVATTEADQLELAILNLVINARDAMSGRGHITIHADNRVLTQAQDGLAAGSYVVVTVTDSGAGMSPDVAAKAFDPFFTTKPTGQGTGLGLAQVAQLARNSGGAARIETSEGVGTAISIWLATADDQAVLVPAHEAVFEQGHGEHVLLADDDEDIRRTVSQMLRDMGYNVSLAVDGHEALAMLDTLQPQLMLLDVAMGSTNGIEVAQTVRGKLPSMPIVLISAHAHHATLEASLPDVRLLRKPFLSQELGAAIHASLNKV